MSSNQKMYSALFFIFTVVISINGQAVVGEPNQYESTWRALQTIRNLLNTQDRDNAIDFKDIKGSPYFDEKFKQGEYGIDDKSLGNFYLRYNVYSDEIEVIDKEDLKISDGEIEDLGAFLKVDNSYAVIDNHKFILLSHLDDDDGLIKKAYFLELYSNNGMSLLKKLRCVLTPAQKAMTFNETDRAAKFTIYESYYLQTADAKSPELLTLKKSKIAKAFAGKEKKVKDYISNNNLNIKKEQDLVQLIQFVSSE